MNTYLKYRSPSFQFLSFLATSTLFFGLSIIISSLFFGDLGTLLANTGKALTADAINRVKLLQIVTTLGTFVLPALAFAYFSSPQPLSYVGLKPKVSPVILFVGFLLLLSLLPFVNWLGHLNGSLQFGGLQQSMLHEEEKYNWVMKQFLRMRSNSDLIVNLVIMALLPALAEELFFRGSLFRVLFRLTNKPWMAIFLTSVIFALLHGTVFKILPIFALGLVLGTVYYLSGNLWYSIVIHFLNNAFAVLSVYYSNSSPLIKSFADESSVPLYQAAISLLVAVLLLRLMIRRMSTNGIDKPVTNEVYS